MMLQAVARSVRRKLMLVIITTTFMALFLSACAMVLYEAQAYERAWVEDLTTQAKIVARVSGPAVAFNDPVAARENLELLAARPQILAAAIHTAGGRRFARYGDAAELAATLPALSPAPGYQIARDRVLVHFPVIERGERVGTVYLQARYELVARIWSYITVLGAAMVAVLALTALIAVRLQRTITAPILAVTSVADRVMRTRDFSLRAEKTSDDEIGVLVDAFNGMLNEASQRAAEIEQSNLSLAQEMVVRRQAEASLKLADRRKDDFLAMLAHELRNPLAPINAAAELLRFVQLDAEAVKKASAVITRQVQHMKRLIDDLLDVSRVTRGLIVIERQPCDLTGIVAEAVEQVRPLVTARQHQLTLELAPGPLPVLGDEKRLVQVIANLLTNAAKYTLQGGLITLTSTLEGDSVLLTVRDNGNGIGAELLPHVFDLFAQAERSSDRAQGGLGLGLALVKNLVELHGGEVAAASEGDGRGSLFTVRLPRHAAGPAAPAAPDPVPAPVGAAGHGLRVLVVDDNRDAALTLAAFLQAGGHTVTVEFDSAAALAVAARLVPQVCLLDIGLPSIDGNELARQLRANPSSANAVLVAITGYGQKQDRETALEAGFDYYFVKPVDTAKLTALLAQLGSEPRPPLVPRP